MHDDFERCYRAVHSRDRRFDGRVFTAVTSTGIYCRPSCPARTPKRENVRFYPSAAAASAAGFRACRRCRPDTLPGSREWDHRADLAARALRLVAAGAVDEVGVVGLAKRLAVSERHLHRVLLAEVGVGPLALARTRRAQTARLLMDQTPLPLTDIAFAAGFASVRQFNDVMREEFGCTPSQLRRAPVDDDRVGSGVLTLRLVHRGPYAAEPMMRFLAARAIPGVEQVNGGVTRSLRLAGAPALVNVEPGDGHWLARLQLAELDHLPAAVAALRRWLDLDADPLAVDEVLARDPELRASVEALPGIRVPGCVDGFELAVRAVVGQQVSVAGARTMLGRIAAAYGELLVDDGAGISRTFPSADVLAGAAYEGLGLTRRRMETIRAVARACASGELVLDAGADRDEVRQQLLAMPGIGPWTADYIAMRALGDPDAFLATDLVIRRVVTAAGLEPERWRPWRAYAAMHLWSRTSTVTNETKELSWSA
ncbi:MAG: AlkA N-terminal domain-containing protein [Candidatus Nanopelagicales bacterium]